ncbi:MAG TPA: aminotransferase class V-fold PLP-dependent enzyme [Planctomycetota bacterium]|nr:aminotransferase class V-fold PLP-dependent enzyme [Planctomycetota bacterium]
MNLRGRLEFRIATENAEFEQIHRLNYRTFVEEIPQHSPREERRLVDKFHSENTYLVALVDGALVGMLACRDRRPFSLDQKVPDLDRYLPPGRKICELRLLAIDASQRRARGGKILQGLLGLLRRHGRERGYNLAIISGTTRQLRLYRHIGFEAFGPLVGSAEAAFQPMAITLEAFQETSQSFLRGSEPVNLLPGPVSLSREVTDAFARPPESHRSEDFREVFEETRKRLCALTRAPEVGLLMGSGTLANDVVAGQISLLSAPGLVLTNGEFGGRLADQARRFGLDHQVLDVPWGQPFDLEEVRKGLAAGAKWVWAVHCETSTGVLNDLEALKELCRECGARLCLDAISSLGTVPVDLGGVFLASGSSGKALRSFAGVSMVFHHHDVRPAPERLARYLDLGYYHRQDGVPFTFLSNLVTALHTALGNVDWDRRFEEIADCSEELRRRLREHGFELLGAGARISPAVITIALPPEINSARFGDSMKASGWLLSSASEYLRRRNWVQICLMGEFRREQVLPVLDTLDRVRSRLASRAPVTF